MLAGMNTPVDATTPVPLADALRRLLRPEQVDVSTSALDLHARGESCDVTRRPDVVVYPTSTEDVQRVLAYAHGEQRSVAELADTALALAQEHGALATESARDGDGLRTLWRARHQAYYCMVAAHPGWANVITDLAVPVSRLAEVIDACVAVVERLGLPGYVIGHVGDGNFHLTLFYAPDDPEARRRVDEAYGELVRLSLAAGGTCTGEHGIGLRKLPYVEAEHGDAVELMWAIKDALDPAGIMNPGKKLPPRADPARAGAD